MNYVWPTVVVFVSSHVNSMGDVFSLIFLSLELVLVG